MGYGWPVVGGVTLSGGWVGPIRSMLLTLTIPTLTAYSTSRPRLPMATLVWVRGTSLVITACRLLLTGVMVTRYMKKPRACSRVIGCQLMVMTVPFLERLTLKTGATVGPACKRVLLSCESHVCVMWQLCVCKLHLCLLNSLVKLIVLTESPLLLQLSSGVTVM